MDTPRGRQASPDEARSAPAAPGAARRRSRTTLVAGLLPVVLGVLALIAWAGGPPVLSQGLPGRTPMVPLTAVGMIGAGGSVLLLALYGPSRWSRWSAGLLALLSFAVGVLTLGALLTRLPRLHLEVLPLGPSTMAAGLPDGPWPALNTGVLFALTGLALMACAARVRAAAALVRGAGALVAGFALLALVGHAYGLPGLYALDGFTPMSPTTAAAFLSLAVGVVALEPDRWLLEIIDPGHGAGLLAQRLIPAVIIVPVLLGLFSLWTARAGYLEPPYALSLLVVATVMVLVLLLWRGSRVVRKVEDERRAAARAVRESEARFRALAENATEAIVTVDEEDRIVFANPGVLRILGHTPEALVGSPFSIMVPERFREQHRQGITRYLRTGQRSIPWDGVELPGLHADGREVPLEITFSEYVQDGVRYFTGIMRDVSARKIAQDRQRFLLEASRLFSGSLDLHEVLERVAQRAVPTVADWCVVDLVEGDGTIRRAAAAHVDPAHVALIRALQERYPPDPEGATGVPAVVRTGEPALYERVTADDLEDAAEDADHFELIRRLGIGSVLIVPIRGEAGVTGAITLVNGESGRTFDQEDVGFAMQLGSLAGIAVDNSRLHSASDRARAEAERRAREERALRQAAGALSATFSTAEVVEQIAKSALVAADADGAFVERIQTSVEQVTVVAASGEVTPAIGARVPYRGSAAQKAVERLEPEILERLSDSAHPFEAGLVSSCQHCRALILPLIDGGEPIGALVLLRRAHRPPFRPDEIERARTFGDLASLAFRKVHILEESERRREELERVSESRARLIRGFSHDVKNPLGAADGFAEVLLEKMLGTLTDRQEDALVRMRSAIRSAVALIDDMLELARAEAGQIEIRLAPTDLREAVYDVAEGYRSKAEAKGLTLDVDVPPTVPVVRSDPQRVRQVLGNLISNAVKYTDEGGVSVRMSLRGLWMTVEVTDTGSGIAAEDTSRLFTEFDRLEPDRAEGQGLGLAISLQVARALGGDIRLDSQVGRGSTFSFWLPCRRIGAVGRATDEGLAPTLTAAEPTDAAEVATEPGN